MFSDVEIAVENVHRSKGWLGIEMASKPGTSSVGGLRSVKFRSDPANHLVPPVSSFGLAGKVNAENNSNAESTKLFSGSAAGNPKIRDRASSLGAGPSRWLAESISYCTDTMRRQGIQTNSASARPILATLVL